MVQWASSQAPVANFTSSSVSGCTPLTVHFTDQSSGSPFSWTWDFGNGQLSTLRNPSAYYSQPGTYTVRLVVRNAAGIDEEVKTNYITVAPGPSAAFSANITTACLPATIQFTDQSTLPAGAGTITSWLWSFGDGNTSTQQHPSHTFTANGFYTISLQVTSSSGCTSFTSIGRYIRIVSGVDVDFVFSEPGTCQSPFVVNFTNQSSGPGTLTYNWNFGHAGPGSTLQNPTTSYLTPGTYSVTLDVQSSLGCSGTITKNITIAGKTTDFNAPDTVCTGEAVNFTNISAPAPVSSSWDFGDGSTSSQISPVKTYFVGGVYQVKLVNDYGSCIDSVTKTITVITNPTVSFTANDTTSCSAPFTVQFTDSSPSAISWNWDFGDGGSSTQQNPSHTYTATGTYTVSLTITLPGGCSNTLVKQSYVIIQPAIVSIDNVPNGGCIPFTFNPAITINTVDPIVSFLWDMGEPGGTYNVLAPSHTYNNAGTYTVSLTVTTQSGCVTTVTRPGAVKTGVRPVVNFSFNPNNVCASTPVQFTDLSTTTPGASVQWDWHFGDGLTSSDQNPDHIYKDTGQLIIKLYVTNNGCVDSATQLIQVLPPVAIFGYNVNCNNRLQVSFTDTSLANPIYGPISYEWRMGDPANTIIFSNTPPTFTYPAYGMYTVTLIVTNGSCSYQTTKDIVLADESPSFTIDKNPVCKGETFTLTGHANNLTNIIAYNWTVGGTQLASTDVTASHSLGAYGNYDVSLAITDINGCSDTVTVPNFVVVSGPRADFSANPGSCINKPVGFTDLSTPAGTITQWNWSFGDGNQQTYSTPPFSHTYSATGSYTVRLIIKDNSNCADTMVRTNAVVITSPKAAFRGDTIYCPLTPLQFIDTSSGSGLTYNWTFGDGGVSTLQNPTHSYPLGNNSYTVKLKIRDVVGCEDSVTKTQYIKIRSPQSAFDIQDSAGICLPLITTFTFAGTDYESFYWDFGDGSTTTAQNPSHFYNSYGSFIPKLYVLGYGGCIDSSQALVNLYDPNLMQITSNPNTTCNNAMVSFSFTTPPNFRFKFFFGDGSVDSSQTHSFTHFYSTPGVFTPYITVYDRFGCEGNKASLTPITVYGAIPLFSQDKKSFCDAAEVFFVNYTISNDPVTSTTWDFGDGTFSNVQDPSHIYNTPGTYIVRLSVLTQNQCLSSFSDTVRVYRTPSLTLNSRDTICLNIVEPFNAVLTHPDTSIVWSWDFGNGTTSQQPSTSITYNTPGDYAIRLIATNKIGCADTIDKAIHVASPPTAAPVTDPLLVISGGAVQLNMDYTGAINSYVWSPTPTLNCTTCPFPIASPQFSTTYAVLVRDRYGCRSSANITVNVICTGQNFFIPNTFSPNGDGSNDVFYLRGMGLFSVKTLRVFNRWGEVVFEKRDFPVNNPSLGWNGTFKGKKAHADVYVYQLEIMCSNGQLIKYSGNIALIL